MPVEVKGLAEVLTAMKKFEPDLAKNLNHQIKDAMTPIQKNARGLVPSGMSGLRNWEFATSGTKINAASSAFAVRAFPKFNTGIVKAGIKISTGRTKKNRKGFVTFFRITNLSAAGQIMEMAGRVHPNGRPQTHEVTVGKRINGGRKVTVHTSKDSQSNNPDAGNWFIHHMHGQLTGQGKARGRLLYKAAEQDHGKTIAKIMKALELTIKQFEVRAHAQVLGKIK